MFAPVDVIVKFLPMQIAPLFTETVGVVLTVTELTGVFELIHPKELVPATV